jgi:hypothetical protein
MPPILIGRYMDSPTSAALGLPPQMNRRRKRIRPAVIMMSRAGEGREQG